MKDYPGVTWSAQDDIGETMDQHETLSSYIAKNILMKCDGLPTMNGPDIPECFIAPELLRELTQNYFQNDKIKNPLFTRICNILYVPYVPLCTLSTL